MHSALVKMDGLHELRNYQSHPRQMKAGAPGKVGVLELTFEKRKGKTVLSHLYRVAPLLVQQALYWDETWPELPICSIISVGGGTLQGDRYLLDIKVHDNAEAMITTQSATRIQEMDANYATQYQEISVGEKAYLEYVPDTTILYKNSRYACENIITVSDSGILLYGETIMLGRKHYAGERFRFDLFSSLVSVRRPDGKLIFSEKLLVTKDDPIKDLNAVMSGYDVFANIICICPPDVREKIVAQSGFEQDKKLDLLAGVSLLPNDCGVILRVVGKESYHVHNRIKGFAEIVRQSARAFLA